MINSSFTKSEPYVSCRISSRAYSGNNGSFKDRESFRLCSERIEKSLFNFLIKNHRNFIEESIARHDLINLSSMIRNHLMKRTFSTHSNWIRLSSVSFPFLVRTEIGAKWQTTYDSKIDIHFRFDSYFLFEQSRARKMIQSRRRSSTVEPNWNFLQVKWNCVVKNILRSF